LSIRRQLLENVPIKVLSIDKQRQLTSLHRCAVKEKKLLQQLIDNRQKLLDVIADGALEEDVI
jgi:hypothetical protein